MKFLFFLAAVTATLVPTQSFSQDKPAVMYEFMGHLYRLQPFMFSQKRFMTEAQQKDIQKTLDDLVSSSSRMHGSKRLDSPTFEISAQALQNHLSETADSFRQGRKEYARRLLISTMDACSSCHVQVPGKNLPQWKFKDSELTGSDFDKGEFLFTTRHYEEALTYFKNFVKNFDAKKMEVLDLETALKRQLVIFVRILRDPARGIKELEPQITNNALPKHVRKQMNGWIVGLRKLSKAPGPDTKKASIPEIEKYSAQAISPLLEKKGLKFEPDSFVTFLATSGLIFDTINTKGDSADLLYYLALCDSQIAQGYFSNLGDFYLKECISKYPKSATAKKCYDELEMSLTNAYTGSSGTVLPDPIKKELKALKSKL